MDHIHNIIGTYTYNCYWWTDNRNNYQLQIGVYNMLLWNYRKYSIPYNKVCASFQFHLCMYFWPMKIFTLPYEQLLKLGVTLLEAQVDFACIHAYPIPMTGKGGPIIIQTKIEFVIMTSKVQRQAPQSNGSSWACIVCLAGVGAWIRSSHLVGKMPQPFTRLTPKGLRQQKRPFPFLGKLL
jgi:hypothetical protein